MPKVLENPHVALNNARNLPRKGARLPRGFNREQGLDSDQKKRLTAFLKARQTRAECDEFIAQNKADVFDILGKLPGGNFTSRDGGTMIYRADSISYKYPADILHQEEMLAGEKKIMQLDGRAERIVKGCVKFEALG